MLNSYLYFFYLFLYFNHVELTNPSTSQQDIVELIKNKFDQLDSKIDDNNKQILDNVNYVLAKYIQETTSLVDSLLQEKTAKPDDKTGEDTNFIFFPGTVNDFNDLIPIIVKSSRCGVCCTCKKNGMCMKNTYGVLTGILKRYPDWTPPDSSDFSYFVKNLSSISKINKLLKNVLCDIGKNKEDMCFANICWLRDDKLKHLIHPIVLQLLKSPGVDSGSNLPLMMALMGGKYGKNQSNNNSSGRNDSQMQNSLLMMALSGMNKNKKKENNGNGNGEENGINPLLFMLGGNNNINPALLAMMGSGKKSGSGSMDQLGLMLAMQNMNKNGEKSSGVQNESAPSCSKNVSKSSCTKNKAKESTCGSKNAPVEQNNDNTMMNPLLLAALTGEIDLLTLLLLQNMEKNNDGDNNGVGKLSGYGKQQIVSGYGKQNSVSDPLNSLLNNSNSGSAYGKNPLLANFDEQAIKSCNSQEVKKQGCQDSDPITSYGNSYGRN